MKTTRIQNLFAAALVSALAFTSAQAQQVPIPTVPGPASGPMTKAYVQMVGRMAYVWAWPMVNSHNRRASFATAPECGYMGGVLPVAPVGHNTMLTDYIKPEQTFVTCPNQVRMYSGNNRVSGRSLTYNVTTGIADIVGGIQMMITPQEARQLLKELRSP